jgi:hypothetical protein
MDFLLIGGVALVASGLTLFSGFGLGTLLLPAFALFLPAPLAVAATGLVHLLNNVFKGTLLWRRANWRIVWRFGVPAVPAAIFGAWLLGRLGESGRLFMLELGAWTGGPTAAGLTIGLMLIAFALFELSPAVQRIRAPGRLMPLGGAVTGFLGGLTGQQGALRSMFLLKSGMDAAQFIATGVMIAILVDLSRVPTYGIHIAESASALSERDIWLVVTGTVAALLGAWLGARHVSKVTIAAVRYVVAALMMAIGGGLVSGAIG